MGSNESSYSTFFDSREETCFYEARQNNEVSICRFILFKRKYVAFLSGDMNTASDMLEMCLEYPIGENGRQVHVSVAVFIDGLIAFYFARKLQEADSRWARIGEGVIELMKQWTINSSWNFSNKLYLLEAEYYFFKNDEVKATEKYELAIKAAHDHRFIHEEGLACEKAACFYLDKGRNGEALVYFTQAKKRYEQWGALGLVNRLERSIVQLMK